MTPAGASTSLTSRINGMTTHKHARIPPWEDQCEWHRMAKMTGPDCTVMCNNLINTHTDRAGLRGCVQFNKYTHTHTHTARELAGKTVD